MLQVLFCERLHEKVLAACGSGAILAGISCNEEDFWRVAMVTNGLDEVVT